MCFAYCSMGSLNFLLGQTAMKNLFVDEKPVDANQTLAPDDGSVAVIFGSPGWFLSLKPTVIAYFSSRRNCCEKSFCRRSKINCKYFDHFVVT